MPLRSILKNQPVTNLISMANDKMLRELEEIVEERDRLKASIEAVPSDFSQLSPRVQSAQKLFFDDMVDQMDNTNALIDDKYILLKETLTEEDMPLWLKGKSDSLSITLVGHKKPTQLKLFRRQSSTFFFQQNKPSQRASDSALILTSSCSKKLEQLRNQLVRRESEAQIRGDSRNVLARIAHRLAIS